MMKEYLGRTTTEVELKPRWYVNFYDMIDGWGIQGFYSERLCYTFEDAKKKAVRLQRTLSQSNIEAGEHYGVFNIDDGENPYEVYCLRGMTGNEPKFDLIQDE